MVKIGWMQDSHTRHDPNLGTPGAQQQLVDDYDYLVDTMGVDVVYFTGDLVLPPSNDQIPHVKPRAYEQFWHLISQTTDGGDTLQYCIPGNHDNPLQTFLDSDPRCVLEAFETFETDGVTVALVNTAETGYATGSAGTSDQGGVATEFQRVSKARLTRLDDELANAGSNAKLILPHAALTPLPNAAYTGVRGLNGELREQDMYNVVLNHRHAHGVLSKYNKTVVPVSHLYQWDGEGSQTVDGVDYCWKYHYYDDNNDTVSKIGYIEISDASVDVKTIAQDRTETTLLSKTF